MADLLKTKNVAFTTLNAAITNSATNIVVTTAAELLLTGDVPFMATLITAATIDDNPHDTPGETLEIVKVTAVSGSTLTVTRAQEGTTGIAFADGDIIEHRFTAGMWNGLGDGTLGLAVATLGVGIVAHDGTFHVMSGSAGIATGHSLADEGVFEGADDMGISLVCKDAKVARIMFVNEGDAAAAFIVWDYTGNTLRFASGKTGASTIIASGNNVTALTFDGSQNATFVGDIKDTTGNFTLSQAGVSGLKLATDASTGSVSIQGTTQARIHLNDSGGAANQRIMEIKCGGESFKMTARSDLGSNYDLLQFSLVDHDCIIGNTSNGGNVKIIGDTTIAKALLELDQNDVDQPFFDFQGTTGANTTSSISTHGTSGATTDHIQVDLNGTKAWIAVSTNNPSA